MLRSVLQMDEEVEISLNPLAQDLPDCAEMVQQDPVIRVGKDIGLTRLRCMGCRGLPMT